MRAVVVGDFGDVGGLHFLIARVGHLQRGGKIGPELEAVHAAGRIALGHFLMDDAAAGGHPLHVAGGDGAVVAHAVAVFDGAGEDVGDGLDAAMRMPGEAGEIVFGDVVAEIVEQ